MRFLPALLLSLVCSSAFLKAEEAPGDLRLTLPAVWYAVPGIEMSLYYDNIVLTQAPGSYRFEVRCDLGKAEARRWTVTPADRDAGDHAMEVVVKDAGGRTIESGRTILRVVPRNAGAERMVRLLIVGDSLTHSSLYPNEWARLLGEPGNPEWTMLGTHKPAAAKPGVAHEGYGGWKWIDFLSKFDPRPPDVAAGPIARKSTSPFLFRQADGKGQCDIARYFREHCDDRPPDVVTFLLGINDCFGANPNDPRALDAKIDEVLSNAEKLLAAFHQAAPGAALAVGLTTPPNARQSAFASNYKNNYSRWGWKRIQHRLVQRMLERFSGREQEGIFLVPTELNLDPIDGYPDNNGVHPNASGYAQIAASFQAWLKGWLAR